MNNPISDDCISMVLGMFEIPDYEYDGDIPEKCPVCGSRAAVYTNVFYVCACTNPHCENSLFGKKRKETISWRSNETKAIHDWRIYIGCKFNGGFYTLPSEVNK